MAKARATTSDMRAAVRGIVLDRVAAVARVRKASPPTVPAPLQARAEMVYFVLSLALTYGMAAVVRASVPAPTGKRRAVKAAAARTMAILRLILAWMVSVAVAMAVHLVAVAF